MVIFKLMRMTLALNVIKHVRNAKFHLKIVQSAISHYTAIYLAINVLVLMDTRMFTIFVCQFVVLGVLNVLPRQFARYVTV
jgi:hypothetical protein